MAHRTITEASPAERPAALDLAFGNLTDEQRPRRIAHIQDLISAGEIDPQGIFVARDENEIHGVFVCLPMAGGSALVWPPRGEASDLIPVGLNWLCERGVKVAQAIVPPDDANSLVALAKHGFVPAGPMRFYQHNLVDLPDPPTWPRLQPASLADPTVFATTLERTYDFTLDFPELSGVRTIDEILLGYRANPTYRPEHWHLASIDGEPVGVLMLSELERLEGWDLTYLGVVPERRNRGVGRALVAAALHFVADAAGAHLEVAVDARNAPAVQLYARLGFQLVGERLLSLVFLRPRP